MGSGREQWGFVGGGLATGICSILGAGLGGFQRVAQVEGVGGFLASRVCCQWDDALGNSGGTVADRTMVQAIVEVPTVRRKGKENELLGNK